MSQELPPQKPRTTGYQGITEAWAQIVDAMTRRVPNSVAYVAALLDYYRKHGF